VGFQARRWHLDMKSASAGLTLDATIEPSGQGLRVTGTSTTREGTREPLDYPVDTLTVFGDSLRFVFAPAHITIIGRCLEDGSVRGHFSLPQPPYGPIEGDGVIRLL